MENTIKLPKTLKAFSLPTRGVPEEGSWQNYTRKNYINLCRVRDVVDTTFPTWSIALFAGGEVRLGTRRYRALPINTNDGKKFYDDDYSIPYDEAELVSIPCVYFDNDAELSKGEVIGVFKDGRMAVADICDGEVLAIESSKVKYISDILEME